MSAEAREAFWDRLEYADEFREWPEDVAGPGEVCCRVCGDPTGSLAGHLGVHGIGLDEYERRFPGAPTRPPEPKNR